jgi:hypothetical protein
MDFFQHGSRLKAGRTPSVYTERIIDVASFGAWTSACRGRGRQLRRLTFREEIMGKRFVPVRDADKRAIDLYLMLQEVEQMPLVELHVYKDSKKPILIQDRNDSNKWWTVTVDLFLRLDVEQAKADGGTAFALYWSRKKPERPRLPQTEVDRAVNKFLSGEDDE